MSNSGKQIAHTPVAKYVEGGGIYTGCTNCDEHLFPGSMDSPCKGLAPSAAPAGEPDLPQDSLILAICLRARWSTAGNHATWLEAQLKAFASSVTAHKEAEIESLRAEIGLERIKTHEREAEVERLRKGIEEIEGHALSAVAINCKLRELLGEGQKP